MHFDATARQRKGDPAGPDAELEDRPSTGQVFEERHLRLRVRSAAPDVPAGPLGHRLQVPVVHRGHRLAVRSRLVASHRSSFSHRLEPTVGLLAAGDPVPAPPARESGVRAQASVVRQQAIDANRDDAWQAKRTGSHCEPYVARNWRSRLRPSPRTPSTSHRRVVGRCECRRPVQRFWMPARTHSEPDAGHRHRWFRHRRWAALGHPGDCPGRGSVWA